MSSKHMATDIDVLRRHLNQETLIMLGHSNGATIALKYASIIPDKVRKCVRINTQFMHYKNEDAILTGQLEWRKNEPLFADSVAAFDA